MAPASALALGVLQNCITLLSESIAQLPIELYERAGDDWTPATDHPLYSILKYEPNPWQTSLDYQEQSQAAAGLRGNSYSFIDRD
ncbi:hypothetical protein WK07_18575 [Burkholderia multivorans]|nr:hypothetical protein WK07_18575 [Burkholderia multivorans]